MSLYDMGFEINMQDHINRFDPFEVVDASEIQALAEIVVGKVMKRVEGWEPDNINGYLRDIGRSLIDQICDLKKPYKFIIILDAGPKIGAAIEVAHIQHWEPAKDGYIKHEWSNGFMFIWITIYWAAV
ncbi:hypothetical protein O3M35_011014 [Rhynocoris fuscipes]|uniref:Dynein light chain n=1 Tax=Rhynocoris fuscipes TaxID=488301 RepID=A0AAW1D1I0_9HEMI